MVRAFELKDLDRVMEIWLSGNLRAHSFVNAEHWMGNYESVRSALADAEVYVYDDGTEILGFIGLEGPYIAGLFVAEGDQRRGIGHRLVGTAKRKRRLCLHVYEKNAGAVAFYRSEGFQIEKSMTEEETGEKEYLMVFNELISR